MKRNDYILDTVLSNFNEQFSDICLNNTYKDVYHIIKNENDDYEIYVNCVGHNSSDITVKADTKELKVTSKEVEDELLNEVEFIKPIDVLFSLTPDYNGQNATADFENGVLKICLPKNEDSKSKTIKING